ncbi:MAG: Ribosomal RNA small subunit methyltransferase I [Chlamydiae bacterium]|nr:Ribosomal RNA small subunit methyltransferase I [Chlamydiota bacterium]
MLYIIATPIGNLEDITLRAKRIFEKCDYLLCEDTRRSQKLLNHLNIKKKLFSFHKFSESKKQQKILEDLKKGSEIGLISDAGTPLICDPGVKLVASCQKEGIEVVTIPGPSSLTAALSLSGLEFEKFQFLGFLPKKANELKEKLLDALTYNGVSIFYESPNRIQKTLQNIDQLAPQRHLVLAKELTKKFETVFSGCAKEILNTLKDIKGEFVLMIAQEQNAAWEKIDLKKLVKWLQDSFDVDEKEAIKMTAVLRHTSKRNVYNTLLKNLD